MAEIIFNTLKYSKHIKLRNNLMPSRTTVIYTGHPKHDGKSIGPDTKKALRLSKVKLKWNIGTKYKSATRSPLFTSYMYEWLQVPWSSLFTFLKHRNGARQAKHLRTALIQKLFWDFQTRPAHLVSLCRARQAKGMHSAKTQKQSTAQHPRELQRAEEGLPSIFSMTAQQLELEKRKTLFQHCPRTEGMYTYI